MIQVTVIRLQFYYTRIPFPGVSDAVQMSAPSPSLCEQCGTANPAGYAHCDGCGAALGRICPACKTQNRAAARFCGNCGEPLSVQARHARSGLPQKLEGRASELIRAATPRRPPELIGGQRKLATVMFADIRGSMALVSDCDPEVATSWLDPALAAMIAGVHRYGGTVNRIQGDGIMGLFGAPIAHEDHAVRACLAACAILDSIRVLADPRIQVRIGLDSGQVLVRPTENDLAVDYDAVGATAHTANRLESMAEPGTAYVSATTFRLAQGAVEARSLGALSIRGSPRPLEVFQLLGAVDSFDRWQMRARSQALTAFTGRELEMTALARAYRRAGEGRGQIVGVSGDTGAGKSRLIHEFTAAIGGAEIVRAAASSHDVHTPFMLASCLLCSVLGVTDRHDRVEVEGRLGAASRHVQWSDPLGDVPIRWLLQHPVDVPEWGRFDPSQRRKRAARAVRDLLLARESQRPLVLVVEDLHWIDPESHEVLDKLVDSLGMSRVFVVASFRPQFQPDWARHSYYTLLNVPPLDDTDAELLIRQLIGPDPEIDFLCRLLVERTGGVPLFIEEMSRLLIDKGVMQSGLRGHRLQAKLNEIRLPETVQGVLAARMDGLPPGARSLLQVASVIGAEVQRDLLLRVAARTDELLDEQIDQLKAGEFLFETKYPGGTVLRFKHALTHAVSYETLPISRRRPLHETVCRAIEEHYAERIGEWTERLAEHALKAEAYEKAIGYLHLAGHRANDRGLHHAAIDCFEKALAALENLTPEQVDQRRMIEIHLGLRVALAATADIHRMMDCLNKAEELARVVEDTRLLAIARTGQANISALLGRLDQAEKAGREGRELARELGDAVLMLGADFALCQTLVFAGDLRGAAELLEGDREHLMRTARHAYVGTTGTPSVLFLSGLAMTQAMIGEAGAARRTADEAWAIAEETARLYDLSYAALARAVGFLMQGQPERAIEQLRLAMERCIEGDIQVLFPSIARYLGAALIAAGEPNEAITLLEQAVARARLRGLGTFEVWCKAVLSEALAAAGRLQGARAAVAEALAQARALGLKPVEMMALRARARIAMADGDMNRAASADYAAAIELAERMGMRPAAEEMRREIGRNPSGIAYAATGT